MVPGTRTMHVLWVVCCHLVLLAMHVMAYPTGEFGESDSLSYSPSYDFIDEYLRHNDEELTPSDSELGDLIWDLLYRPNAQTLPWKRNAPGIRRRQSWDVDNGRHHKRQQGWYTDYGKRQQGWHSDYGKRQQGRNSDYGKRQQGWHSDYGKRQLGWNSDYGKRQQGWHSDYGKRQQGWHSDYGKRQQGWHSDYDKRQQGWHSDYGKRQQGWHIDYGKRQQGWHSGYGKRQQSWHIDYGKRQQGWNSDYGKRQQGWHSDYGKRQQGWHSDYGKRQQGWHSDYGKRQQGWHSDWKSGYATRNEDNVSPRDVSLNDIYNTLSQGWRPTYRKRQQGWHVDYGKRSKNVDDVTWDDIPLKHHESLGRDLDLQPYTPNFATGNEPNADMQDESSGYEDLEQEIRRRQLSVDPEQDGFTS